MQKQSKFFLCASILLILASVLGGCKPKDIADPNARITNVANTVQAQQTGTAAAMPTATNTLEPTATFTQELATATATMTETPSGPTNTPTITVAVVSSGQNNAVYAGQSPDDGTKVTPGKKFTVTWKLVNKGTTTWTPQYYIQFVDGAQMGAAEKVYLPYNVGPDMILEIKVEFTAPSEIGQKTSKWRMTTPDGVAFGDIFYIMVEVASSAPANTPIPSTATPTITPTP